MKSIASCTAADASGWSSLIFNMAATCFSSSDLEEEEEEKEEEEESEEDAVPICRDGSRFSDPMFKESTSFTALFASRRPPEKLR